MNRLIVLRHAKAAQVPGSADAERPLTERGERDAGRAGRVLRELGLVPDLVLCSPSVRTRRTAELVLAELAPAAPVEYEREIYEAYADDLLELVRRTDPEVRTLLLVGHNPGVHELTRLLADPPQDGPFPPGALAVIEAEVAWAELWPGSGRMTGSWRPEAAAEG